MQPTRKINPAVTALIVIVLIGVVVGAVIVIKNASQKDEATTADTPTTQNTQPQTTNPSTNTSAASYKNGTYTKTGSYSTPGGRESIEVTVTLANDIVTDASVKGGASSGEAKQYQNEFISGYKTAVVGKDVDEVSLSRVAGSSLTSNGFNAALKLIKVDAGA